MRDYKKELEDREAKDSAALAVLITVGAIAAMVVWKIIFRQ